MAKATILQLVLVDETGDSYYRMRWPARDLAAQKPDWRIVNLNASAQQRFEWALRADLLVLYQCMDLDLLPVIYERKQRGLKTLAEYNDNFYAPPEWSPHAREWSSPLLWQTYETLLQACDALMVTGPGLFELFSGITDKPIHIIENHLPHELPANENKHKAIEDRISIGWAGSLGHMADLLYVMPLISEILNQYPKAHLHLMGNESIPELINIPRERFSFKNWGGMQDYYEFWQPIHLGLAPLLDTPYNWTRSDIKAVEMSSKAVLPILQKAKPYDQFLKETSMPSFSKLSELKSLLQKYLSTPSLIAQDCQRAYDYVRQRRIGLKRMERAELYQALLPQNPAVKFNWPVDAGFHELELEAQKQSASAELLQQVQELWKKSQRAEACQTIKQALEQNPAHPELQLMHARILCALNDAAAAQFLSNGRRNFPRDLRYLLLQIRRASSTSDKQQLWQELIEVCRKSPQSLKFFEADIITQAVAEKDSAPLYEFILTALLKVSAHCAPLLYHLAMLYEKSGRFELALDHFKTLREMKSRFDQNYKFLDGISSAYLAAWCETLKARTQNG